MSVPVKGARTIYSRIGDLFAWCCTAMLAALIVAALVFRMPDP
jgi:apolipoprotein N-acyltransferase